MKVAVLLFVAAWLVLVALMWTGNYTTCRVARSNAHDNATAWYAASSIRKANRDYATAKTYGDVAASLQRRSEGSCIVSLGE